jgi:2-alkyl-3-oxoalkanoate reductase
VERAPVGVYNVVDDEPAPVREWLPVSARALGAEPPRRAPSVALGTATRGASNAKIKLVLRWSPRYPSWRQGFSAALG